MESFSVLVVGSRGNRELSDCLLDLGLVPVFRTGMEEALDTLRSERQAAIVLDQAGSEVDAVELVLNVREFTAELPVVIAADGMNPQDHAILMHLSNAFVADCSENYENLGAELDRVLKRDPGD